MIKMLKQNMTQHGTQATGLGVMPGRCSLIANMEDPVFILRMLTALLIAAQKNIIRTNHMKARIDKTQQNNKHTLCGDRDETINQISECSKLAQKEYKTRHDLQSKVILWEMIKNF